MLKAYALKFRPEGMNLPFHWWRLKGIAVHSTSNAATERDLSSHDFELGGESDDRYPSPGSRVCVMSRPNTNLRKSLHLPVYYPQSQ